MTPLVVLVGFLGSGKTTLLRKLVPDLISAGLSPSIILNDYRNATVDAELFRELSLSVKPISGSCVCCGSREELLQSLRTLQPGENSLVLVESNGTTDSTELIALLASDPGLRHFTLPFQISIVDVKRWQKRFWHNGLEADQTRTASCIYLGHADEVKKERRQAVIESLQACCQAAPILPLDRLFGELQSLVRDSENLAARVPATTSDGHSDQPDREHPHDHTHDSARHHFAAEEIQLPEIVDRELIEAALRDLPPEVLRAKGILRLREDPDRFHIFQKVEHFDEVQWFPLQETPANQTALAVFIGSKIPEDLRARFTFYSESAASPKAAEPG